MSAGPDRRPVVVMRRLTPANLPVALLYRMSGRRVIFLEPLGALRSASAVAWLGRLGLEWVDYHAYGGFKANSDLRVAADYARQLTTGICAADLADLCRRAPGLTDQPEKARCLLYDHLVRSMSPVVPAYALAEYFQDQGSGAQVFHAPGPLDALIAAGKVTQVRNRFPRWAGVVLSALSPVAWVWLAWAMKGLVRRVAAPRQTLPGAGDPSASARSSRPADVLFFPHMGLAYGKLFAKDQFYADDPESPFHPSRIHHVELGWLLPEAFRQKVVEDYRRLDASVTILDLAQRSTQDKAATILAWFRRALGRPVPWARAMTLGRLELQCRAYHETFQDLRGARLALIDSDNLFPRVGIIALQAMGIKVATVQERFMSAFHRAFVPMFDLLCVHGPFVEGRVRANDQACVSEIAVTGDPHVEKIANNRTRARSERVGRFAGFNRVCLALDYHSLEDPFANAMTYGPDWRSNLMFYDAVADLAAAHPDCAVVVRGKNDAWLDVPQMARGRARLGGLQNVFIDREYDRFDRSYELAAMADLVVARYTSLCDQCLAAGIPVLMFDALPNGDRHWSLHDYDRYPVMVRSVDELLRRAAAVLRDGDFMDPGAFAEMRRLYYGVGPGVPPARQVLQNTLRRALDDHLDALLQRAVT